MFVDCSPGIELEDRTIYRLTVPWCTRYNPRLASENLCNVERRLTVFMYMRLFGPGVRLDRSEEKWA